ncbi:MAG: divergent PAP2 family protein [Spirochaetaceae bacterium]|jgi:acid phosphatase family membrane protein YuiD|nr:divergent PAP2 family protein [Spirochaetaceae bacterium]
MQNTSQQPWLSIRLLIGNPVFITAITTFIISQMAKALITFLLNREKSFKEIFLTLVWSTGGMPSSHAALVSSMATSTALYEGISSTVFVISLFLALIVIRDALGVRRAAGMQARALNSLGRDMSGKLDIDWQPVKEIQGHTPLEVTMGSILGITCAILLWLYEIFL